VKSRCVRSCRHPNVFQIQYRVGARPGLYRVVAIGSRYHRDSETCWRIEEWESAMVTTSGVMVGLCETQTTHSRASAISVRGSLTILTSEISASCGKIYLQWRASILLQNLVPLKKGAEFGSTCGVGAMCGPVNHAHEQASCAR